jgi:hypothetical protein
MQDTPERVSASVQIAAFVSPHLRKQLLVKAARNDRTLSAEIRRALKQYLKGED